MKKIIKRMFLSLGTLSICFVAVFSALQIKASQNRNFSQSSAISFVDSDAYIKYLLNKEEIPETNYSLSDFYPIYGENQMTSELCWIYSSSKALELSIMAQKNEYYNFSEMGTALLGYFNEINSLDDTGNFKKFNLITQSYGLIHGSDLSNDIYLDINEANAENYKHITNLADSSIMEDIKPILISEDVFFGSRTREEKILILKQYISEFGGFYSGLRTGIITNSNNTYTEILPDPNNPDSFLENVNSPDKAIKQPHAVCIIGWDEKKGWLALNSWGRSALDYETFYIPYDVNHVYETASGYICINQEASTSLTNSSAKAYSQSIKENSNQLKNMFVSGEEISLSYKISEEIDFEELYVNVYNGQENVTNLFELDFSETGIFTINSLPEKIGLYSNEYVIRFYTNEKIVSTEAFFVYTGTELSYAELVKGSTDSDSVQLNSTISSGTNVATYYVSSGGISDIEFKLNLAILETMFAEKNVNASIGNIYETTSASSERQENTNITISINPQLTGTQSQYAVSIYGLTKNNTGKLIEFSIILTSTQTGHETEYFFKFFISQDESVTTKSSNAIIYCLNGGKNSNENITRYPNFAQETLMTEFLLKSPTRSDSAEFVGWFTDPNFENEIVSINSSLSGEIVLYAKWKVEETNFFESEFKITNLKHYGEEVESDYNIGDTITYGDSINIGLSFAPNAESLIGYNYYARYHYFLDDKEIVSGTLKEAEDKIFKNSFKNLSAGKHKAKIVITMVISRSYSITKSQEIEFQVSERLLTLSETSFKYEYNQRLQTPALQFNGLLEEDKDIALKMEINGEEGNTSAKDVGTYVYQIKSLSNKNYKIDMDQAIIMEITPADFYINLSETNVLTYNGMPQKPKYTTSNTGEDLVEVNFSYYKYGSNTEISPSEFKNVGKYKVVPSIASKNYKLVSNQEYVFTINKAEIKIIFDDIQERYTVEPNNRKKITYKIEGLVGSDTASALEITCDSEGLRATKSGVYTINGSYISQNYNATIVRGTYTILGFYRVYYTLPNGEVYEEVVDDGYKPKGITPQIYKKPFLSKIVYDKELVQGDGDLVVKVSYVSYAWLLITAVVVSIIVVAYFIFTKQSRRMKNR